MAFPSRLLNDGEHVVVDTRSHVKSVLLPILLGLVTVAAMVWLLTLVEGRWQTVAVLVVGLLVLVALVGLPLLRWATTTFTFTNRRFVKRSGFLAREGRTIPLNRISGVDFEIGIVDRIFGCGTLIVSDASEQGRVELDDIPQVERVQTLVAAELHRLSTGGSRSERADDGS